MSATREYLIDVTQEHIDCGDCRDPDFCAVALGIADAVPFAGEVDFDVSQTSINLYRGGETIHKIDTPLEVGRWIEAFDGDKASVKPFQFMLPIPLEALREDAR